MRKKRIYALGVVSLLIVACWFAWLRSPFYFAPLTRAAQRGDTARVAELIRDGADLDRRSSVFGADNMTGWTALMWASARGHAEVVRLLVDAGADMSIGDRFGQTALHLSFIAEDREAGAEIVEALLRGGADPDAVVSSGNTALHLAVLRKDWRVVEMLLAGGADVNAVPRDGRSPLDLAVFSQPDLSIVRLLLDAGADTRYGWPGGRSIVERVDDPKVPSEIADAVREADAR